MVRRSRAAFLPLSASENVVGGTAPTTAAGSVSPAAAAAGGGGAGAADCDGRPTKLLRIAFDERHDRTERRRTAHRQRGRMSYTPSTVRIFAFVSMGPWYLFCVVLLCFSAVPSCTGASSSSSSSSQGAAAAAAAAGTANLMSDYESVRALDEYGNAVQIQHAQAAADQRGRLILALRRRRPQQQRQSDNNKNGDHPVVWIVSPAAPKAAHHRTSSTATELLQPVSAPEPPTVLRESSSVVPSTSYSAVYLCCTGVQADATWLLQAARRYATGIAERYGNHRPHSIAYVVAQYKSQFWNNRNNSDGGDDDCWTTTLLSAERQQQRQQRQTPWGRPLGVRSLVVSCGGGRGANNNDIRLQVVEPSGIVREISSDENAVWVMGKNSDLLWQELAKQKHQDADKLNDDNELKRLLWRAFREVLSNHNESNRKEEDDDAFELQLEIVSSTGEVLRETLSKASLEIESAEKLY